jgi:hypothetical protein
VDNAFPESAPADWNLGDWEKALTLHVGTVYACRECGNLAIVTRGGLGVMEMVCCGKPMKKVDPAERADGEPRK